MRLLAIGSDPEFPCSKIGSNIPVSVVDKIGGNKYQPRPILSGSIQEDGVMLELNSIPASNKFDFIQNHKKLLSEASGILEEMGLQLNISSLALYPLEELQHPLACLVGCDPDYNAWDGKMNSPPDLFTTQLRAAAGHLHISFEAEDDNVRRMVVRLLDAFLTYPLVMLWKDPEEIMRRFLYGRAGAFRPKYLKNGDPFDGVEYRVLGNFWLQDDIFMEYIYDTIEYIFSRYDYLKIYPSEYSNEIINTINFVYGLQERQPVLTNPVLIKYSKDLLEAFKQKEVNLEIKRLFDHFINKNESRLEVKDRTNFKLKWGYIPSHPQPPPAPNINLENMQILFPEPNEEEEEEDYEQEPDF